MWQFGRASATSEEAALQLHQRLKKARVTIFNHRQQAVFTFWVLYWAIPCCPWLSLAVLDPGDENVISLLQSADPTIRAQGGGRHSLLSLQDQLFMVLCRFRLGLLERDLAYRFGISDSPVSGKYTKWINYLYLRLRSLPVWPAWENVAETMLANFKETYPSTSNIIDATEIFVEVPASLSLQSQNFSTYQSHTTHKGLIGIAPKGCITFVSELFTALLLSLGS